MTLRAVGSSVPPGRSAPYILAQSAVPVCLAPNGTVATNGVVTLGTALPTTYSGGIWLRLPANAVVGGLAGLYWAVMTSTTQGQVFTNFADPATEFIPFIPPAPLVNAAGSNAAYTQTTGADITLVNKTLPGGSLGINGVLTLNKHWHYPSTVGAKTLKGFVGTANISFTAPTTTTAASAMGQRFRNRGVQNRNYYNVNIGFSGGSSGVTASGTYSSIDTAVNQAVSITAQIATATDFAICEGFSMEILPS